MLIGKSGSDCLTGFHSSRDRCRQFSASDREAIAREDGRKRPTGWYRPGDYCVEQQGERVAVL